ncbi:hypothetical protein CEXT_53321 [Caerostris extrusa]|uniref:Maturase K n=1 Tax=Caerostris extrusa TaxID=172846 RepID=A0AAV4UR78_CAEEX|nr:hypothetical protein CEXT_53321 [Caerostris extrusa]
MELLLSLSYSPNILFGRLFDVHFMQMGRSLSSIEADTKEVPFHVEQLLFGEKLAFIKSRTRVNNLFHSFHIRNHLISSLLRASQRKSSHSPRAHIPANEAVYIFMAAST